MVSIGRRVELLEEKVEALTQLPGRVARIEAELTALRAEIRAGDEETRREMRVLHEDLISRIHTGDEETRREMRVLHENLISRIALIQEGIGSSSRPRRRIKSRKKGRD